MSCLYGVVKYCTSHPYKTLGMSDLSYFLHHGTFPEYLKLRERRALRLKYAWYHLINSILFCLNYDGVLLRCLKKEDVERVLKELHDGPAGGNFAGETTSS
jgi:hypothetical protein